MCYQTELVIVSVIVELPTEPATILGVEMVEDPLQVIPDLATTDLIKVNIADQKLSAFHPLL